MFLSGRVLRGSLFEFSKVLVWNIREYYEYNPFMARDGEEFYLADYLVGLGECIYVWEKFGERLSVGWKQKIVVKILVVVRYVGRVEENGLGDIGEKYIG